MLYRSSVFLILLLFWVCPVMADSLKDENTGEIHVKMSDYKQSDSEDIVFSLTKVGNLQNGSYRFFEKYVNVVPNEQIEYTADMLNEICNQLIHLVEPEYEKQLDGNNEICFEQLDDGIYLLYVKENNEQMIVEPSLITLPFYDESSNEMNRQVEVFPKYIENKTKIVDVPVTGDDSNIILYLFMIGGSTLILLSYFYAMKRKKRS